MTRPEALFLWAALGATPAAAAPPEGGPGALGARGDAGAGGPAAHAGGTGLPGDAGVQPGPAAAAAPPGPTRAEIARLWSAQRAPFPGAPQAVGAYANGCLVGGVALPLDGPGYQMVRPKRGRGFGHPALVGFVKRLAATMKKKRLGPLIVGDLGQPRGGPTPTGHRSHQSGLDADLWYTFPPAAARRPLTASERERVGPGIVVDLAREALTPSWEPRVGEVLALAASDPDVDRVFVHPVVKRALCEQEKGNRQWLARVRPWWGHHDHFHVRLRCPPASTACEPNEPIGEDDGCGATLAWWFSQDARATREQKDKTTAEEAVRPPAMPEACAPLVAEPVPAGPGRGR